MLSSGECHYSGDDVTGVGESQRRVPLLTLLRRTGAGLFGVGRWLVA